MQTSYINIHVKINEEFYELFYGFASQLPIVGIEEGLDSIVACFNVEDWNDDLLKQIEEILQLVAPDAKIQRVEEITNRNWNEEWEKTLQPIKIDDDITITPQESADDIHAKYKITIVPKMSFGTGHHQTTRLVCKLMKNLVHKGSFWIDAGTGSGVLAILAAQLGADKILAFDYDEWAFLNATENVALNGLTKRIDVIKESVNDITLPAADGILANMFKNILIESFPKFRNSLITTDGDLIISGLLIYDKQEIVTSAERHGFKVINTLSEDEWIAIHLKTVLNPMS